MPLTLRKLRIEYGGALALSGVNAEFGDGEVSALVGRNGAGKTTLLNAVAGQVPIKSGEIAWDSLTRVAGPGQGLWKDCRLVPETRNVFPDLTVRENLHSSLPLARRREWEVRVREVVERFPILGDLLGRPAGLLSGGERQILAVARATMARPRLLLVDEPSLGLAPIMVQQLYEVLVDLNASQGTTIVVAEQTLRVESYAHVVAVLETGQITELRRGGLDLGTPSVTTT